ncbi:nitrate- and nitrite sensing domain-containing protein [Kitasatospora sp. NBC_01560]
MSAEALARPGSVTDALRRQRQLTDDAVRQFQALSGETADSAPGEVQSAVTEARQALGRLAEQRSAIDRSAVDQQTVFSYYTDLIAVDLRLFTALSHVDNGEVTWISKTLVNAFWAKEMLAREDALLARGWPSGKLTTGEYQQLQQAIGAQDHLFTVQVVPYIPAAEAAAWQDLMTSPAWQSKAAVEQSLVRPSAADAGGAVRLPASQEQWRQAVDQLNPQLVKVLEARTDGIVEVGKGSFLSLLTTFVLTTVIGLVAVIAVILTSWRLTRSLRRRIKELQSQAQELERTLPEVVERLAQGEQVDVEAESRAITAGPHGNGTDELARLGEALNLARTSALETAVRQAEQHRGFERLLQRIARRTQLLIGQQLRKLDELERKHEDPEILEGLFDLDHLTARLRRYEENLVILAGGQPQRRFRKPVPLLDVLRAAQGEVQDYRRIMLDVEGHPWLSERAVGPVAHVLAELMENAATFSKPPTPVEVRAAMVGRGLAVEIEDRGLGMDPQQYDAANRLMSRPPRTDVLARADDIRLGFYVVARLAANSGLKIEFRPSAFGGTRVVVLVPDELVIDGDAGLPDATPVEPIPLARRSRKASPGAVGAVGAVGDGTAAEPTELARPGQDRPGQDQPGHELPGQDRFGQEQAGGERSVPEPEAAQPSAVQPPETVLVPTAAGAGHAEAFAHVEYIRPLGRSAGLSPDELLEQPADSGQPVEHGSAAHGTGTHDSAAGHDAGPAYDADPAYATEPAFGANPAFRAEPAYGTGQGYGGDQGYGAAQPAAGYAERPPYDTPVDGVPLYDPALAASFAAPAYEPAGPAAGGPGYDATAQEAAVLGTPAPGTPGYETPAYPDIAYATVTPAEAPYADEQYRPADNYRLAERRERREYAPSVPFTEPSGGQPPLPQRVRQASLAAELRVPPRSEQSAGATGFGGPGGFGAVPAAQQQGGPAAPFERPARRSGAAIGAFQRQSRAARGQGSGHDSGEHRPFPGGGADRPSGPSPDHGTRPASPTEPAEAGLPTPAPGPSPWALPAADSRTTRTDDQS